MDQQDLTSTSSEFEFETTKHTDDNAFSVALLFYIISACAMLLACLRTVTSAGQSGESVWYFLLTGLAIGFFSSGFLAVTFMRFKNIPFTGIMGCIVGVAAGALAMVRGSSYYELMLIAFGGCWLQIAVNCIAARYR